MSIGSSLSALWSADTLVDAAALLQVAGFLIRDQLILRLFVFSGTVLYALYYYFAPDVPLWQALGWSVVLGSANLSMILRIAIERTTFSMSAQDRHLYQTFRSLSPGEFRRLLRVCTWVRVSDPMVLTRIEQQNDRLFCLLEGEADVRKGTAHFTLGPGSFVGEVSFLLGTPATATVTARAGALIAIWRHDDLMRIERRHPAIRIGLREILNVDLAAKVKEGMRG